MKGRSCRFKNGFYPHRMIDCPLLSWTRWDKIDWMSFILVSCNLLCLSRPNKPIVLGGGGGPVVVVTASKEKEDVDVGRRTKKNIRLFWEQLDLNHSFVSIHVSNMYNLNWRFPFLVEMERIRTRVWAIDQYMLWNQTRVGNYK
jgi:hypothetical protein